MAKFYKGNWRGTYYEVNPIGIYKHLRFFGITLPYISGEKIRFEIKITKWENENCPKLNQLEIWERFIPDISVTGKIKERSIKTLSSLPDDAKIGKLIDEAYITGNHAEYWIGYPDGDDSHPLLKADLMPSGEFYMKFILPAFTAFATFVITITFNFIVSYTTRLK